MAWPSVTFPMILTAETRQELEQLCALLQGYLSAQHKDDGSHSDITADSIVTDDLTVNGAFVVNGSAEVQSPLTVLGAQGGDAVLNLFPDEGNSAADDKAIFRQTLGATLVLEDGAGPKFRWNYTGIFQVDDQAKGTGATIGNTVIIGRNTSGNGAAGWLGLFQRDGGTSAIWADANGIPRINTSPPTENGSVSDTAGNAFALMGVANSGAIEFTGLITASGGLLTGTGADDVVRVRGSYNADAASQMILAWATNTGRIIVQGADTSTNAGFSILSTRSNGSNLIALLSITDAGAGAFASSLGWGGGSVITSSNNVVQKNGVNFGPGMPSSITVVDGQITAIS